MASSGSTQKPIDSAQRIKQLEATVDELRHALVQAESYKRVSSSPRLNGPFNAQISNKVSKLQALARGFMTRIQFRRRKVHHAALESGVLYAMKNTVQGIFYS